MEKKTEDYFNEYELEHQFRLTRGRVGVSLETIAQIIKRTFDRAEVKSLIKELK